MVVHSVKWREREEWMEEEHSVRTGNEEEFSSIWNFRKEQREEHLEHEINTKNQNKDTGKHGKIGVVQPPEEKKTEFKCIIIIVMNVSMSDNQMRGKGKHVWFEKEAGGAWNEWHNIRVVLGVLEKSWTPIVTVMFLHFGVTLPTFFCSDLMHFHWTHNELQRKEKNAEKERKKETRKNV